MEKNIKRISSLEKSKLSIQLWEQNANKWIHLTSKGHDLYRDFVGTPGFFSVLPDIRKLYGLDIGCGDGHHTSLLAREGAKMVGVDLCKAFITHAIEQENKEKLGIEYLFGDALNLPFKRNSFDFVTSFFSFLDIPDHERALKEAYRVLKPGGFLQFLISHPFTSTPGFEWISNGKGRKIAGRCGNYFARNKGQIREWTFENLDYEKIKNDELLFQSLKYRRTLSGWINAIVKAGFVIERIEEPRCNCQDSLKKFPLLKGANILPIYLVIRAGKS